MNDPWEFRCVHSDHSATQSALDRMKSGFCEGHTAQCYSRSGNNILMWSHYGDRHKGICLGFDTPDELTRPVVYVDAVERVGDLTVERREDFDHDAGLKIVERLCSRGPIEEALSGYPVPSEVGIVKLRCDPSSFTLVADGEFTQFKPNAGESG